MLDQGMRGSLQPDMTKLYNPQWARWFDRVALSQGQDPSQPYNLNMRGMRKSPPLPAMREPGQPEAARIGANTRLSLQALKDMYGVKI